MSQRLTTLGLFVAAVLAVALAGATKPAGAATLTAQTTPLAAQTTPPAAETTPLAADTMPLTPAVAAPNPNDPCIRAGRDSCGTTGVGMYRNYQFGLRWFGDFRGAVAGVSGATFCIDLNYWFPGRSYGYKRRSAAGLKSRQGTPVSPATLHRLAYAIWTFGRSNDPQQQAATMLYVHSEIPNTPKAQVARNAIGSSVASIYGRISTAAAQYAGPYRLTAQLPSHLIVGSPTKLTLSVRSSSGAAVPNVRLQLQATGARGVPRTATSGADGTATVTVTPTAVKAGVQIKVTAAGLPSTLPLLFVPTRGQTARNGQRLIGPASQTLHATATATVSLAHPKISSKAAPQTQLVGQPNSDAVTISGLPAGAAPTATVQLFGPAPTAAAISCTANPVATRTLTAKNGTTNAPAIAPAVPGFYGYRISIPASASIAAAQTPCAPPGETFEVTTTPAVHTIVSSASLTPGASVFDTLVVTGLAGQTATVDASLFGPYPTAAAINCKGTPVWTGTVTATGDGTYRSQPTTLATPGYYVYVESIPAQGFVNAAATQCSDTAETTIVRGSPMLQTQVSDQTTAPGDKLTDSVVVSGLGALSATINVQLWGPFASRSAIACTGTPAFTTTIAANGDGTYTSAPFTLQTAGYYVYQESIAPAAAFPGVQTSCTDRAETTLTRSTPTLITQVSSAAARPGSQVHDTIKVAGLGKTAAPIKAALYGPFASRGQIRCTGRPVWQGTVKASGDGSFTTAATTIRRVGFYVYHETMAATTLHAGVQTPCTSVPETSLAVPEIITGGAAPVFKGKQPAPTTAPASVPTQVTIPRLQIDAQIQPGPISLRTGDLVIPSDIHKVGWWQDGSEPGDKTGTTLLAGHIDHAGEGPGAFFQLAQAGDGKINVKGMIVTVKTRSGASFRYRIVSVRRMLKSKLPTGIFTVNGAPKLVLVTCGGPFNFQTRHFADNVVVTAVPA